MEEGVKMNLLYLELWSCSLVVFVTKNPMTDFDSHSDDSGVQKVKEKIEEGKGKNLQRWWFFSIET